MKIIFRHVTALPDFGEILRGEAVFHRISANFIFGHLSPSSKSAVVYQISSKSDDFSFKMRFHDFKMADLHRLKF